MIDDGFDLSLPGLAGQESAWAAQGTASTTHGTVVALLIREVAPAARLLLYPAAENGKWNEKLIERALLEIPATPASIVNLSFGLAVPVELAFTGLESLRLAEPWPNMTPEDLPWWLEEQFGLLDDWGQLVKPPKSDIGEAASAVAETGRTVIAAVGNSAEHLYSPAIEAGVFSVGYQSIERAIPVGLMETAKSAEPTFSQSGFTDFLILQPRRVLGSSFATPLMSGFAALMRSRADLPSYRRMGKLAGAAASLMAQLDHSLDAGWSERRDHVINELFKKAVNLGPHPHFNPDHYTLCPECAYFAENAYVNYGLFLLNWNDLDVAEQLLCPATAFAPSSPHARANLGASFAKRAVRAQEGGEWTQTSALLRAASRLQGEALALRPDHEPYRLRAEEFREGAKDPSNWKLAP